ncbi:MAG: DUF3313 family protein [Akkermansiaceae bacterium]
MLPYLKRAGPILPLLIISLFGALSCTQPAAPSGFLEQARRMQKSETSPFQRSWKDPKADFTQFQRIEVSPVSTEHTRIRGIAIEKWKSPEGNKMLESEVDTNARSLRQAYQEAFRTVYQDRWQLAASPNALKLELHLVEIAPSQPLLETAGFFLRGGGLINRPSIAIEGRFRDPHTGKVIMTFADRSTGDIALVDFSKFQSYSLHRKIMQKWAHDTVVAVSIADGEKVPQPSRLKLITW